MRRLLLASAGPLLLAIASSGCLDEATKLTEETSHEAMHALSALSVGMHGCTEAGSVSMYNIASNRMVPEPFEPADIRDDMGNPTFGSYADPITGPATGIWHMSVICDSYDYNGHHETLEWGWVGVKILPPPWDGGTIERQFILADLSFGDEGIQKELVDGPGFHVSHTLGATIEWVAPDVIHTLMQDTSHGKFETVAGLKEYRALDMPDTRFWFPVSTMAGHTHEGAHDADPAQDATEKWIPRSIDLHNTALAGSTHWVVNQNARAFAHTKDQAVGPVMAPGIEHYGYTGAAVRLGAFDRHLSIGPAPEGVLLDETYTH